MSSADPCLSLPRGPSRPYRSGRYSAVIDPRPNTNSTGAAANTVSGVDADADTGTRSPTVRTGVYPGSFNPLTTAHLAIAQAARIGHYLERIDLSVSVSALGKEQTAHPRFDHRIEVLQRATADLPWLSVTTTDHQLLVDIADGYDVLIIGADKWHQIQDPVWYDGDAAARDRAMDLLPRLAVAPRDDLPTPPEITLPVEQSLTAGVSSTAARDGAHHLMVPAARDFAEKTGAWIDPERYDRWLATGH